MHSFYTLLSPARINPTYIGWLILGLIKLCLIFIAFQKQTYFWDDSFQYLQLAKGLPFHYSQTFSSAVPDLQRVPLYPFFLKLGFGHPLICLFVQSILHLLSAYWVYHFLAKPSRTASIITWIYLLMPTGHLFSLLLLSETLYVTALIAGCYYFQKAHYLPSAMAFSLAVYTRPNALLWVLILLTFSLIATLRGRFAWKNWAILSLCLSLTIGIWIGRNYAISGNFRLSSLSDNTLIHGRLGGLLCYQKGLPFTDQNLVCESETYLIQQKIYPLKTYYSHVHQQETELYTTSAKKAAYQALSNNLGDYLSFQLYCAWKLYQGMGYQTWKQLLGKYPAVTLSLIQLIYTLSGILVLLWAVWRWKYSSLTQQILMASLFASIVLSCLPYADTRYRFPIDSLLFLLLPLLELKRKNIKHLDKKN